MNHAPSEPRDSPAFAPLGWLLWRATVNRGLRRAQRARQPRYALAVLAGLAYFWFVLYRPGRQVSLGNAPPDGTVHLAYALGFALLAASWWLVGSDQVALNFSPAEVQLLFPAPVTRRQLVALKLLQWQLVVLFSVLIWVALLGRAPGSIVLRAVSLWIVFTTLHLHRVGASLVRESTAEHGAAGARRHLGPLIVFGAAAAAIVWGVVTQLPLLRAGIASGDALGAGVALLHTPITKAVLYPFRLVLAPLFTRSAHDWVLAVWPAFLILVGHYVWVMRTDAAFEEAAAENSARRARAMAARSGRHGAPVRVGARRRLRLPLAAHGAPAIALVWKNTLALGRTIALRTIIAISIILIAALVFTKALTPEHQSVGAFAGRVALGLAAMLVFAGPLWVRNDLRLDLMQLELLHSYPIRGSTVVRAEVGASLLVLSGVQLLLVLVAYAVIPAGDSLGGDLILSLSNRTALLAALVIMLPVCSALGVVVQNAGALLFPAWMRLGLSRPGGIEAVGQSILTMFGSVVVVSLLLLLPGVAGGVLAALTVSRFGLWGVLPGSLVAAALVAAELWWITAWLGRVFERTESVGEAGTEMGRY